MKGDTRSLDNGSYSVVQLYKTLNTTTSAQKLIINILFRPMSPVLLPQWISASAARARGILGSGFGV